MAGEDGEHLPLVVLAEMEKTVPGNQAVKGFTQRQRAHVMLEPALCGELGAGAAYHGLSAINAGQCKTLLNNIPGNRLAVPGQLAQLRKLQPGDQAQ